MESKPVRILSTKKLLPGQRQFLLNAGLNVIEADFISIEFKKFLTGNIRHNLIFTSRNAFESFLLGAGTENYTNNKIFCVGSKTEKAITDAGFNAVASADYAEELARIITGDYKNEPFTFFSGSMRRDTLPEALKNAGVDFNEIEVYKTALTPQQVKPGLSGILFFSPSGVESYLKENTISNETCFCIGTTTAAALEGITQNVVIANKPTVENVIIQCINYYKKS